MTHENKLGMFIHWGPYAMTGLHEQALARYDMSHEEYENMARNFNPTKYDPESWVLLAKEAGMKYICFTAKHHDGFCMWDTKETDYNIMNTPYGKDVLAMLSEACKKHGMLLSIYYSNPDWYHEYGYNPGSSHQWKAKYKDVVDTEKYREFIKAQVRELLTGYGEIYTFFWDIPPAIEDESLNALVRELQPSIYINDRGWSAGDFSTPEREYQSAGSNRFIRMTEACNSVGEHSWGYRECEDFYTKRFLTSSIDRYMALGASYLLNVGPNADGVITEDYRERILTVGDWYNRMSECLECSEEDTFEYGSFGSKCIPTKKDGKTYLNFYEGIISSSLSIKKYPSTPKKVKLMNSGKELPFAVRYMPNAYAGTAESMEIKYLHIYNIDADSFASEPIVIEIEW